MGSDVTKSTLQSKVTGRINWNFIKESGVKCETGLELHWDQQNDVSEEAHFSILFGLAEL